MFKKFFEETSTGDIAQAVGKTAMYKKCMNDNDEKCTKDIDDDTLGESAVGARGRTDSQSALAHLTPELKKRFRKLLKDVGGKTVMRYLLADAPLQSGE